MLVTYWSLQPAPPVKCTTILSGTYLYLGFYFVQYLLVVIVICIQKQYKEYASKSAFNVHRVLRVPTLSNKVVNNIRYYFEFKIQGLHSVKSYAWILCMVGCITFKGNWGYFTYFWSAFLGKQSPFSKTLSETSRKEYQNIARKCNKG